MTQTTYTKFEAHERQKFTKLSVAQGWETDVQSNMPHSKVGIKAKHNLQSVHEKTPAYVAFAAQLITSFHPN